MKIVERCKSDTPNIPIHDRSLYWLGTGTPIKISGVKLVLWAQTSSLSEIMGSCKCFPHVIKMSTLTLLEAQFSIKTRHQTFNFLIYELTIQHKKKTTRRQKTKIIDTIPFT